MPRHAVQNNGSMKMTESSEVREYCYGSVTVSRVIMTGVFVIVGAALFMSPPLVGCGCLTLPQYFYKYMILQFLGFTFINLRISNQVAIFTPPSRETSHPEHLHKGLVLSFSEERSSAF